MLTDPVEIEIASHAQQKNVRDPNRSRKHFDRIFEDFLNSAAFENKRLLDLGPGQFDFGELAKLRGAEVIAIERDPALVRLGKHKGFHTIEGDLKHQSSFDQAQRFDGLFCKFSINAYWAASVEAAVAYVHMITEGLAPDGWSWIAPWNGIPNPERFSSDQAAALQQTQIEAFQSLGFNYQELTDEESRYYGVHGKTTNCPLFTRNLNTN